MNLHDIIELLANWNLIRKSTRIEMIKINNKRNMYVHPSKTQTINPFKDSKEMIKRISQIMENEFKVKSFVGKELQISDTKSNRGFIKRQYRLTLFINLLFLLVKVL